MMRLGALLFAGCLLAACATPAPAMPDAPDAPDAAIPSAANDTCGAGLFRDLVGRPIDGPGVPAASRVVRHIPPNSHVTMDYAAQRMNIETDAAGVIRKINCG